MILENSLSRASSSSLQGGLVIRSFNCVLGHCCGRYWHDAVYKLPGFDAMRTQKEEMADEWHAKTEAIYQQTLAAQVAWLSSVK